MSGATCNPEQQTFPTLFEVQVQARVRTGRDLRSVHVTDLPEGTLVTVEEIVDRRARISRPVCGWISETSKFGGRIIQDISTCTSARRLCDWSNAKLVDFCEKDCTYKLRYNDPDHSSSQPEPVTVQKAAADATAQEFLREFLAAVGGIDRLNRMMKRHQRATNIQMLFENEKRIMHDLDCIESRSFQDSWITQEVADTIREYLAFRKQFYTFSKRKRTMSKQELNRLKKEAQDAVNELKHTVIKCDAKAESPSENRSMWDNVDQLLKLWTATNKQ